MANERLLRRKMDSKEAGRAGVFERAREILSQDTSIPLEEKEAVLKLIQVLVEAADLSTSSPGDGQNVKTVTEEIISKHSLLTAVKQHADELDALRRLSLNLTSSLDLPTVLDAVVGEAMHLVKNSRSAHIFLYTRGKLQFGAALDSDGTRNTPVSMPRRNGLTYSVAEGCQTILVEDMSNHELYRGTPSAWKGSIIGIPLKINNNVVGVMNLSRSTVGEFRSAELRLLGLLADQAAVAISNASLHKMVTEQANSDSVTGLPNRRALDERLEEEARFAGKMRTYFAVIMMDLDGFKAVNDTYGHALGDEVLRSLFNYLAGGMRSTDFLARYGGDELTLILHETDMNMAKAVGDKILNMMREFVFPFPDGRRIALSVSGGIAVYPIHSRTVNDLLRAADASLYYAKKHHRGGFLMAQNATGPLPPGESLWPDI